MLNELLPEKNIILVFNSKQKRRTEASFPILEADFSLYPPLQFYRCERSINAGIENTSYFDMTRKNDALAFIDHGGRIDVRSCARRNVHAALALTRQYIRLHQGWIAVEGSESFRNIAESLMDRHGLLPLTRNHEYPLPAVFDALHSLKRKNTKVKDLPLFFAERPDHLFLGGCYKHNARQKTFRVGLGAFLEYAPANLQTATTKQLDQALDSFVERLVNDIESSRIQLPAATRRLKAVQLILEYARIHDRLNPDILDVADTRLRFAQLRLKETCVFPPFITSRSDVDFLKAWYRGHKQTRDSIWALKSFLLIAPPNIPNTTAEEFCEAIHSWITALDIEIGSRKIKLSRGLQYAGYMKSLVTEAQTYGLPLDVAKTAKAALGKGQARLHLLRSKPDLPIFMTQRRDRDFLISFHHTNFDRTFTIPALESFLENIPENIITVPKKIFCDRINKWVTELSSFVQADDNHKKRFKVELAQRYINVIQSLVEYGFANCLFSSETLHATSRSLASGRLTLKELPDSVHIPTPIAIRSDFKLRRSRNLYG